ncbi:MAG TPA: cobalt ECF transporter T component CbiQ [Deltaproteobacteria bacterium]|nr:cobalt ECF transporter T component CbiQ [Deltaproteobacteria bacterium]
MHLMEDFALNNKLSGVPGELKALFAGLTLLVCVFSTSVIVPLVIFGIMLVATVVWAGIPLKFCTKLLSTPAGFGLIAFLTILFFFGMDPWFTIPLGRFTFTATKDGLELGLISVGRMLGGVSCLLFLALTTPTADIFAILKKFRLPTAFIELSMLIYRYIFIFLEEALRMEYAQKMRLGYPDFKGAIHAFALLASNLFIRGMENADKMLIVMNARCYDGVIHIPEEDSPLYRTHPLEMAGVIGFELVLISLNFIAKGYGLF